MNEDIFILIESYRLSFTYVEQIIADYFLSKSKPLSIEKLSEKLSVSKSSITRFSKKVGLNNYKELIFLYNLSLDKDKQGISISSSITSAYHSLATRSDHNYDEGALDEFCKMIHEYKIIHFLGKGFNSYAGYDFEFKISRLGKYVRVISDENSIEMTASLASKNELILVSSLRGEDSQLYNSLEIANKNQVPILLITSNKSSNLIKLANVILYSASLTTEESFGNISPQIPILIQLDMVYERYVKKYQLNSQDWFHAEKILHK